jgi:hypothetical protein
MRWTALMVALLGCQDPDGNGAIEITGYLDRSRVGWTRFGADVVALGSEAAASSGSTVSLENTVSGELRDAVATDLGTFLLAVPAADADRLVLRVDGAPAGDDLAHDVPAHGAFPDHVHLVAHADPHDPNVALVEVAFDPARDDGRIWVANPQVDGAVAVLDTADGGFLHLGQLDGSEGDVLRAHWAPDDGVESVEVEVPVGAAAP